MTKEEAAEVILGGDAWQPCPGCNGNGELKSVDGHDAICAPCNGGGYWRTDDYAEACVVLKREYPKKMMCSRERKQWLEKAFEKFPLKDVLNRNSLWSLRKLFPPANIPDEELAEYEKKP